LELAALRAAGVKSGGGFNPGLRPGLPQSNRYAIWLVANPQRPKYHKTNEPPTMHHAITGNIGSGKTTVCRIFEHLGVPVYYADAAAKRLMLEDAELKSGLISAFGPETYFADGQLNRNWLAKKAFSDDETLATLNALVHPAVHQNAERWKGEHREFPYTLYEAAIVFEIGGSERFDQVIVVAAPEETRRDRVIARDSTTSKAFAARAAKQWPDDKKEAAADHIIVNDGKRLLLPQVLRLHRLLSR
jgi:dephospho-CoA kinase